MGHDHSVTTDYSEQVRKVLIYTLILNLIVALAKVLYGFISNSVAMMSDGFHSIFDGASNVVGLIGIWIASRPPDEDHPYGHRKYETLFTILIAVMLFTTCLEILKKVYHAFREEHITVVTQTSFIIMLFTIGVNIFVMIYEKRKGKQLGSEFLVADARHTQSDVLVSLTVIASLFFTKMGYRYADIIVGIIITFFIARIGYEILKDASNVLVDTACIDHAAIRKLVNDIEGVRGCHDIRSRGSVNAVYLDLHMLVDRNMSTENAHCIADSIEETIKEQFPSVADVIVHVEPDGS
jgi:cation diffusion facilitator family transporter